MPVVSVLLVAGCAGASTTSATATDPTPTTTVTTSSSVTAASTGSVVGTVRMYGGPMNFTTGKQAMNGEPAANQSVTVRSGSHVAASGTTDTSGRFRIELAPGRYTLSCSDATAFTVVAGATVAQDCNLSIP